LVVEHLCSVKGLGFTDLMDEDVTETIAFTELIEWYSTSAGDSR